MEFWLVRTGGRDEKKDTKDTEMNPVFSIPDFA